MKMSVEFRSNFKPVGNGFRANFQFLNLRTEIFSLCYHLLSGVYEFPTLPVSSVKSICSHRVHHTIQNSHLHWKCA